MKRRTRRLREVSSRAIARQAGADVARASFANGIGRGATASQWADAICGAGLPLRWGRVAGRAAVRTYAREQVRFNAALGSVIDGLLAATKEQTP